MATTIETPARIEPCELGQYPPRLADLVSEVTAAASNLGARLPPTSAASLAGLVRVMNCYYSNLSTPKGPVSLRFSSSSAEALLPRLFPAQA
jgi:hypothetical protein